MFGWSEMNSKEEIIGDAGPEDAIVGVVVPKWGVSQLAGPPNVGQGLDGNQRHWRWKNSPDAEQRR